MWRLELPTLLDRRTCSSSIPPGRGRSVRDRTLGGMVQRGPMTAQTRSNSDRAPSCAAYRARCRAGPLRMRPRPRRNASGCCAGPARRYERLRCSPARIRKLGAERQNPAPFDPRGEGCGLVDAPKTTLYGAPNAAAMVRALTPTSRCVSQRLGVKKCFRLPLSAGTGPTRAAFRSLRRALSTARVAKMV
jgi:hypothetical protein